MIYITGDMHRDFTRLYNLEINNEDMIIILGDFSINYYLDRQDKMYKKLLNSLDYKIFTIRGNHEERPENIKTYKEENMFNGKVYIEKEYPNLIFAKDGEIYNIDNNSILVIGGAYSVDKDYRIKNNYTWFKDEQLTKEEMNNIYNKIKGKHIDIVLTHTCPYKYEPTEVFVPGIDESKVDRSMEYFLDKVEENIDYNKWYCGHFHTEKQIDNLEFMYKNIKILSKKKIKDSKGYTLIKHR